MMDKQARRGFTLIELLVVIAIIAILAAILFPVFTRAKKSSLKSTCLSNFKQVGLAMLLYVDDNGGRYPAQNQDILQPGFTATTFDPAEYTKNSNTAAGVVWTLRRYVKSTRFWKCPLGARRRRHNPTYDNPHGISINTPDWGMVAWIEGPGIGLVCTNYSAFALTRNHPPMRHDLAPGGLTNDKMCAMGKTPGQFLDDCRREGYQPWMFHDSYANTGAGYTWVPHGGIGGVYYDGHVQFFRNPKAEH